MAHGNNSEFLHCDRSTIACSKSTPVIPFRKHTTSNLYSQFFSVPYHDFPLELYTALEQSKKNRATTKNFPSDPTKKKSEWVFCQQSTNQKNRCLKGLDSDGNFFEHILSDHFDDEVFHCPMVNCCRKFLIPRSLDEHMRKFHVCGAPIYNYGVFPRQVTDDLIAFAQELATDEELASSLPDSPRSEISLPRSEPSDSSLDDMEEETLADAADFRFENREGNKEEFVKDISTSEWQNQFNQHSQAAGSDIEILNNDFSTSNQFPSTDIMAHSGPSFVPRASSSQVRHCHGNSIQHREGTPSSYSSSFETESDMDDMVSSIADFDEDLLFENKEFSSLRPYLQHIALVTARAACVHALQEVSTFTVPITACTTQSTELECSSSLCRPNSTRMGQPRSSNSRKRPAEDDSPGDEDNDDDLNKRRNLKNKGRISPDLCVPYFACPFFKHSPERHKQLRSCRQQPPSFKTVTRVKQHVYENHALPIRCNRCSQVFQTSKLLESHQQERDACAKVSFTINPSEGINKDKETKLRSKAGIQRMTEKQRWEAMYRIIFGEDCEMPSPYVECNYEDECYTREDRARLGTMLVGILPARAAPELGRFIEQQDGHRLDQDTIDGLEAILVRCVKDIFRVDHIEVDSEPARIRDTTSSRMSNFESSNRACEPTDTGFIQSFTMTQQDKFRPEGPSQSWSNFGQSERFCSQPSRPIEPHLQPTTPEITHSESSKDFRNAVHNSQSFQSQHLIQQLSSEEQQSEQCQQDVSQRQPLENYGHIHQIAEHYFDSDQAPEVRSSHDTMSCNNPISSSRASRPLHIETSHDTNLCSMARPLPKDSHLQLLSAVSSRPASEYDQLSRPVQPSPVFQMFDDSLVPPMPESRAWTCQQAIQDPSIQWCDR